MRKVLLAGKETQKGAALPSVMVSYRSLQHGIFGFQRIQDRSLRDRGSHFNLDFGSCVGQCSQMKWENDSHRTSRLCLYL